MHRIFSVCTYWKQFSTLSIALLLFSFSVGAAPFGPGDGPGGPILVIKSSGNPFSLYTAEILRAEGLNEFASMDISAVTSTILNNYDVVILGEMTVNSSQVTLLTNWVNAGGRL